MALVVNGEFVSEDVLRQEAEILRSQLQQAMPNEDTAAIGKRATDWARENAIERILLNQAAVGDPNAEMVHAAHIVKNIDEHTSEPQAFTAIHAAQQLLQSGRSFADVADHVSDCRGGGGDLGWFPRGTMVEEFERVVFALRPGEVSEIFRSPFGFHITKVIDRSRSVEEFVDCLRARADIREV